MPTDMSEKGLETLIVESLIQNAKYEQGSSKDYDREHAVDIQKLCAFIVKTQPETAEYLDITEDNPKRVKFLHSLQGEIAKRGIIDDLRLGIKDGPKSID